MSPALLIRDGYRTKGAGRKSLLEGVLGAPTCVRNVEAGGREMQWPRDTLNRRWEGQVSGRRERVD